MRSVLEVAIGVDNVLREGELLSEGPAALMGCLSSCGICSGLLYVIGDEDGVVTVVVTEVQLPKENQDAGCRMLDENEGVDVEAEVDSRVRGRVRP